MKHKPSPYLWSLIVVGDTGCVNGKNVRGKLRRLYPHFGGKSETAGSAIHVHARGGTWRFQ